MGEYDAVWVFLISTIFVGFYIFIEADLKALLLQKIYQLLFLDSLEVSSLIFNKKYSIFFFVLLALVLGGLSSSNTATDSWYISLTKSSLNPPGFVFGIVWPILYFLMSISAYKHLQIQKIYF